MRCRYERLQQFYPCRPAWETFLFDAGSFKTDQMSRRRSFTIRVIINVLILSLTIVAIGCVLFLAKETRYLLSATDRATQEEVQRHLGQPSRMTTDETGEAVWTYHIREFVQGGNNAWTMAGTWWCDNYTLTFDAHGILRHWMHDSQQCNAT